MYSVSRKNVCKTGITKKTSPKLYIVPMQHRYFLRSKLFDFTCFRGHKAARATNKGTRGVQRTNCVSLRLRIIRHTVAVVYWPNEILKFWCTVRNLDEQNAWSPMSNFVGRSSARIWVLGTWITDKRASCETGGRHVEESDYGISCFLIPIQTFQILFSSSSSFKSRS